MSAKFSYKGIQGNKYTEGTIEALNREEAAFLLKEQKIIITSISKVSGKEVKEKKETKKKQVVKVPKKIPTKEIMVFTKKLETMVRAGLPIIETINLIKKQTEHKGMLFIIEKILIDVESGIPLSEAFAKYPNIFGNVYINLLRAGESSGKIDTFLQKLLNGMEKDEKIKAGIKKALTYPIILLFVAIAVIVLMMVYVVPVFQDMFSGSAGGLPPITQLVVDISEFIRDPMGGGLTLVLLVLTFITISTMVKKNLKFRRKWHALLLKLPLFGDLIQKSSLAKISMIQGNLSAAGVPVMEALDISASAVDNLPIQDALTEVKRGVFSGDPLSKLFENRPHIFPLTFTSMTAVGEKTGNMEEMYHSIATYYEAEMDESISRLTEMLEPIMIVFMGLTVGFILIAMYTPMFQMGQTL